MRIVVYATLAMVAFAASSILCRGRSVTIGSAVGVGVDAIIEGQQVIYTRTALVTWRF